MHQQVSILRSAHDAIAAACIARHDDAASLVFNAIAYRFADGLVVEWVDFLDTASASYLAGWMPDMPSFAMSGPAGR
jgi:hypothetical protein